MKKVKGLRILIMLAVAVTVMAASLVVASAATSKAYTGIDNDSRATVTFNKAPVSADGNNFDMLLNDSKQFTNLKATVKAAGDYKITKVLVRSENGNRYVAQHEWLDNLTEVDLDMDLEYCGKYTMYITYYGESKVGNVNFYVYPSRPNKIKIVAHPDFIEFNTGYVDPAQHGAKTRLVDRKTGDVFEMKNFWNEAQTKTGLKPGTKYNYMLMGCVESDTDVLLGKPIVADITTASKVKPVIKSVKISNFKQKKYFDKSYWATRYSISYTMTVTLSKKPANTNGIIISYAYAGQSGKMVQRTVKTTKKTATIKVVQNSPVSYKNTSMKVYAATYSNKSFKDSYNNNKKYSYKAVSYLSKAKSAKLR